jgi:hypothetical protein
MSYFVCTVIWPIAIKTLAVPFIYNDRAFQATQMRSIRATKTCVNVTKVFFSRPRPSLYKIKFKLNYPKPSCFFFLPAEVRLVSVAASLSMSTARSSESLARSPSPVCTHLRKRCSGDNQPHCIFLVASALRMEPCHP